MKGMTMDVLQKLLMPWQSRDLLELGSSAVGGPVVRAGDAATLRTPHSLLTAFGVGEDRFGPDPAFVDVVRFEVVPLMTLERPSVDADLPWPTYSTGFLRSAELIPVWLLQRTRYSRGAECWRIHADGQQELTSVYDGSGRGWRTAPRFTPPDAFTGPCAQWEGSELAADFVGSDGDLVELIAVGERPPEGFDQVRPMVWAREVEVAACETVFERVLTCTWRGVRCRVLDRDESQARLLLLAESPDDVRTVGAGEVEPGVFEVTAPRLELADLGGYLNQYQPSRS